MSTCLNSFILLAVQAALVLSPFAAGAKDTDQRVSGATSTVVRTEDGQQIPAGAFGVARIHAPRVATLLQLRGVMGSGTVILRSGRDHGCLTLPVRFVAGGFGGDRISVYAAEPIRLIIRSARVAKVLAEGDDVVSDTYRISSMADDPEADIIIQSGLGADHGFVLNPGSSIVADIFGTHARRTACREH